MLNKEENNASLIIQSMRNRKSSPFLYEQSGNVLRGFFSLMITHMAGRNVGKRVLFYGWK